MTRDLFDTMNDLGIDAVEPNTWLGMLADLPLGQAAIAKATA